MIQRLKYWIFQRGKHCRCCCLFCEYYDLCRNEVAHEKTEKKKYREFALKERPPHRCIKALSYKDRTEKRGREHEKL